MLLSEHLAMLIPTKRWVICPICTVHLPSTSSNATVQVNFINKSVFISQDLQHMNLGKLINGKTFDSFRHLMNSSFKRQLFVWWSNFVCLHFRARCRRNRFTWGVLTFTNQKHLRRYPYVDQNNVLPFVSREGVYQRFGMWCCVTLAECWWKTMLCACHVAPR